MSESTTKFRLVKKGKDPKFDIDNLEHYDLLLQIGFADFQLCITDSRNKKVLLLEDYIMKTVTNQTERVECLEIIFDDHHLLLAGFWNQVKVLVKNRKFVLFPSDFFISDKIGEYLRINTQIDEGFESFFHKSLKSLSLVNIFAVNSRVVDFFNKIYSSKKVEYYHQSSVFINGFKEYTNGNSKSVMCINLDRFSLILFVLQNGQFKYYNQFPIKDFNDYMKYIGMVIKEFNMNVTQDCFYVWGYLSKKSAHYSHLKKYLPNLEFGKRPPNLKFGYVFDEIPEHQYFDLLSFNLLSN